MDSHSVPDFGIMLKSYAPDLHYAERFIESFRRYAIETIPLYVVVPDADMPDFELVVGETGTVLPESLWADQLVDYPIHGNDPGYINQRIIKLAFGEKDLLANYLCADSETVFIRPFSSADFMADPVTPFTFVTEDHELRVDPIYFARYGKARDKYLMALREYLQLPPTPYATCHNLAVFSGKALASLRDFMAANGLTHANLMEISPYEFSWYNFWLEKSGVIPRVTCEPIFEMVHMSHQRLSYALKETKLTDLSRGYVGVVVNSADIRGQGELDLETDYVDTLARSLTLGELIAALWEKIWQRAPRVRKIFRV